MDDGLTLAGDFPPVDEAAWLAEVEAALRGAPVDRLRTRTEDGFHLEPLYTRSSVATDDDESGFPGSAPFLRGSRAAADPRAGVWQVRAEHAHPDLVHTNEAILTDLERGVSSILVRFDREARWGRASWVRGEVAVDGMALRTVDHLDRVLAGVLLDLAPVALDAGHSGLSAAGALLGVAARRDLPLSELSAALRVDPLGARAASGWSPAPVGELCVQALELAAHLDQQAPQVSTLAIDTAPYVAAGATAAQELALLLASGVEWFRAAERAGVAAELVARQIEVTLAVDADVFASIAKLRAARWLWSRLTEECGAGAVPMSLVARTPERMYTRVDPWVNLLRGTAACFAAATGGADAVTVLPFDHALGLPEGFGRRLARNTQVILAEESHLGRVLDPGGGSFYLEARTRELAQAAWSIFQSIEAGGGLVAGLDDGSVAQRLAESHRIRAAQVATRRRPLTGLSEFPLLDADSTPVLEPDLGAIRAGLEAAAAELGDSPAVGWRELAQGQGAIGPVAGDAPSEGEPLPVHGPADEIEALRAAAEAHRRSTGSWPTVFLANLGSLATHTARTGFATNLLAVGGIEASGPEAQADAAAAAAAFTASGATVACLCSSDERYGQDGAEVAAALRAAGARRVLVAGRVEIEGVDEQIALGVDVVDVLTRLHAELGIAPAEES